MAVKSIDLYEVVVDSPSKLTYEDMTAIFNLPNLQHFTFYIQCEVGMLRKIFHIPSYIDDVRKLMDRVATEYANFEYVYAVERRSDDLPQLEHMFRWDWIDF